ncbi:MULTISPECIES: IS1182 family transposase [Paenibacillus]|uniref:IS1182 family transposase n=1 Tax=Paenibacillus campinasensis TaxID=66347 RepID=A0A268EDH5_9BACL|nr:MULTISPECIES: IS1182 family transposase [Paenibacillus]MUG69036.1 IS1182 family transposase [Paenibacillus campinasensis]PAD71157.1 IS5/IS1182 family transposase [Paenibacillus campinasensis]PAK47361.1 IS5/IS1182 family transposase [Paenibacillus sp. 7541]
MLRSNREKQQAYEFVSIEELVPHDHLLRKVDKYIDFSFIDEKVRPLYCADNGRPAIDPVVLFKMIFLGYFYGIRSERQLEREIQTNLAYRWFLGLGLTDKVPDHTTISWNRRTRFKDTTIFQDIFDEIVLQAIEHRMVGGRVLVSDSTHVKANANKHQYTKQQVLQNTRDYMDELNGAVEADRKAHGKKPLKPREDVVEKKEIKVSKTDPDSGYMIRDGKPEGFFYLDHRTVDLKYNLITDVHVTPGNVHDSVPYLSRLDRQRERFGFEVEAVALDSGYLTTPICKGLQERGIFGVIAHRRFHPTQGLFPKWKFTYDAERNRYICPLQHELLYRTTNREGYRQYASDPKHCKTCPMLEQCTRSRNHRKVVTRHVWEDSKEWVRNNRLSRSGKYLYRKRKETIERSFADAKELHGFRYCRLRGLQNVREQALMTATVQNMKKMAIHLDRLENRG